MLPRDRRAQAPQAAEPWAPEAFPAPAGGRCPEGGPGRVESHPHLPTDEGYCPGLGCCGTRPAPRPLAPAAGAPGRWLRVLSLTVWMVENPETPLQTDRHSIYCPSCAGPVPGHGTVRGAPPVSSQAGTQAGEQGPEMGCLGAHQRLGRGSWAGQGRGSHNTFYPQGSLRTPAGRQSRVGVPLGLVSLQAGSPDSPLPVEGLLPSSTSSGPSSQGH